MKVSSTFNLITVNNLKCGYVSGVIDTIFSSRLSSEVKRSIDIVRENGNLVITTYGLSRETVKHIARMIETYITTIGK